MLTEQMVLEIRRLSAEGMSGASIGVGFDSLVKGRFIRNPKNK